MKIFINGILEYRGSSALPTKDFDADGFPVVAKQFTDETECFIETQNESRDGENESGKYPQQGYKVSLDYDDVEDNFNPQEVRLTHDKKGVLGVFTVKRIEYFDITRTINIFV